MRVEPPLPAGSYAPPPPQVPPAPGAGPVQPASASDRTRTGADNAGNGARAPLQFSVGDGTPRVNVQVSVIDESGRKVHSGQIARIADRTIYAWTPPADAAPGHYSIRWQGQKAEPGTFADLTF